MRLKKVGDWRRLRRRRKTAWREGGLRLRARREEGKRKGAKEEKEEREERRESGCAAIEENKVWLWRLIQFNEECGSPLECEYRLNSDGLGSKFQLSVGRKGEKNIRNDINLFCFLLFFPWQKRHQVIQFTI